MIPTPAEAAMLRAFPQPYQQQAHGIIPSYRQPGVDMRHPNLRAYDLPRDLTQINKPLDLTYKPIDLNKYNKWS